MRYVVIVPSKFSICYNTKSSYTILIFLLTLSILYKVIEYNKTILIILLVPNCHFFNYPNSIKN